MRRHFVVFAILALFLHGCSASNTAAPPTPSVATSTSSVPATADAAASDHDANLPADTTPQRGGGVRCGVERWPVKTLSDNDARNVSLVPVPAPVAQLRSLHVPATLPAASRVPPVELTTYWVLANVVEFKLEADRDIHVVISDIGDPSQTMIVEFPDASSCAGAADSVHAPEMRSARSMLVATFGQPSSSRFTSISGVASFVGVGFFDVLHGQTGVAPNGIELHPVIAFASNGAPAPPVVPPPAPPPALVPPSSSGYEYRCEASDCNCADFPSHAEAQRVFVKHGGSPANNWSGLDRDHDGIACESLR
ncbi:MAG: excalibur calcium-binding domain-containing protein [Chloroflexota bacterium]|nr:excalibur calcium-binding domain-containing protein [Chloroflexota bacterium]